MNESLDELLARLNWARDETKALEAEISRWIAASILVSREPHEDPAFHYFTMEIKESVSVGIRARSGTIANEIRSCLDALATTLAEANGKREAYFPVGETEDIFETDPRMRRRIEKFRTADAETLLSFRPFATGKDGEPGNLLIYGLHHADIRRKHHRLSAKDVNHAICFGTGTLRNLQMYGNPIRAPGKTRIGQISLDSTIRIDFEPILAYTEPNVLRGLPLIKTLDDFADVSETVVRAFL